MSQENGDMEPIASDGRSASSPGDQHTDTDGSGVSHVTWSQYTSVDSPSPRVPGSLADSVPPSVQLDSQSGDSTHVHGHGEPPEDISSAYQEEGEATRSDYLPDSQHSTDSQQVNGQQGGGLDWQLSMQGGFNSPTLEYQTHGNAPFALSGSVGPQQPWMGQSPSPTYHSTDDQEEEEQRSVASDRTPGLITGNGPVPRDRGNIGESLGSERNPPNGI